MLSLATPWWLLGLLLLPVIRWLHRGGRHRRSVPVARLGLWRAAVVSPPAAGERRPPDPAWRRRALLVALLCLALAEPQLPARQVGLTLWVDDSISMQTREAQGTRLAVALAQARSLVAKAETADVEVRALGDPWQSLGPLTDAVVNTLAARAGRKEPAAPPPALLRADRLHWLVTDGADAGLLDWPAGRRADRVIQVGAVTRNVGINRLSARRNPDEPEVVDLLLELTNGGNVAETRVVVFSTGVGEVVRSSQRVEAGASVLVMARVAAPRPASVPVPASGPTSTGVPAVPVEVPAPAQVVASLQPGDALAEDDRMVLDLAPLQRRQVAVDPACPTALVAAVASHPGLAVVPLSAAVADVVLDCTTPGAPRAVASIGIRADRTPAQAAGPLQWSSRVAEGSRLPLSAARLQLFGRLEVRPGDQVLLARGGEPVIVSRAGAAGSPSCTHRDTSVRPETVWPTAPGSSNEAPAGAATSSVQTAPSGRNCFRSIETALDFRSPALAGGPEIPLLVNLLFEHVLDARLLDTVAAIEREPAASRVVPVIESAAAASAARTLATSDTPASWARLLLLLVLPVLLWEIAALARQWTQLRPGAGSGAASP